MPHSQYNSQVGRTPNLERLRRAAYAQPRLLLAGMAMMLVASTWWAVAQRQNSDSAALGTQPLPLSAGAGAKKGGRKPYRLTDLPQLVRDYGQRRAVAALTGQPVPGNPTADGTKAGRASTKFFPLTEVDLTRGNLSDEREPVFRPGGDFIAFSSNGADRNGDGTIDSINANRRYHIWIMRRDGSQQRQVTGFSLDASRDQRSPSWAPNGNQLVYVDGATPQTGQLFIVNFSTLPNAAQPTPVPAITPTPGGAPGATPGPTPVPTLQPGVNTPTQITFFPGEKRSPSWSPNGTAIAFAANAAPNSNNNSIPLGQFDIFTISPTGTTATVRRLTGDTDNQPGSAPTQNDPNDLLGNQTNEFNPSYSLVNPAVLFFSSNRENGRRLNIGRRIFAMNAFSGANKRQITVPTTRAGGSVDDIDDRPSSSLARQFATGNFAGGILRFTERLAFQSNSRINAGDTTKDNNIWSLGLNTSDANSFLVITASLETTGAGIVESNRTSSPGFTTVAGFPGATEDKADDVEPSFSRSSATAQLISPIVFSSSRRAAAAPGFNSANPTPVVVNPGGGTTATSTHDIWTTNVQDFSPPELVPLSVGNQLYPFLAPGRQAPFFAPRTAEEGLQPGGKVVLACVIREPESGLATASISVKDADRPLFNNTRPFWFPNDKVPIKFSQELPPQVVLSAQRMQIFDDGPVSRGGNERQANAIRGDGIFYCQVSISAVDEGGNPLNGDFYVDLTVTDNLGNGLVYDHVFGFSTRPFVKNNNNLFVSDYTVGQQFPQILSNDFLRADIPTTPVETYYLSNPSGTIYRDVDNVRFLQYTPQDQLIPENNGPADLTTFNRVDIWRILSRGPLSDDVIRLYTPTTTDQVDPAADPNNDDIPGPFVVNGQLLTRRVAVAETGILWASPYTGDVFGAPGTLFDVNTQRQLTTFLNNGGRLLVTGQDVIYALSNAGSTNNQFLQDELRANWNNNQGERPGFFNGSYINTINGTDDPYIPNRTPLRGVNCDGVIISDPPRNLELPRTVNRVPDDPDQSDGAHYLFQGSGAFTSFIHNQQYPDIIRPVTGGQGVTVNPLYNYDLGGLAGQRIERANRNSGIESRVVFLAFGMEAVQRKYRTDKCENVSLNFRSKLADNIVNYLETGRISGRVVNQATNLPVPNFLIQVSLGNSGILFLGRTDANGNYEIAGIPSGRYSVQPAVFVDANGVPRSLNGGYFSNPNIAALIDVRGGETANNVDFQVNQVPPATISGRVISDRGTPLNTGDDLSPEAQVVPNLPVLLRSIDALPPSDRFPGGGIFAALTSTDAFGRFTFDNVPGDAAYEVVLNPRAGAVSRGGDIPDNSGIDYGNANSQLRPNPDFGRRVIPRDPTYPLDYPLSLIQPPAGSNTDLGDIAVPPAGNSISGRVLQNNAPAVGVTVSLNGGGTSVASAITAADGSYVLANVQPGTYTVVATATNGATGQTTVTIQRGSNVAAPDIRLTGGSTGPTPTPGGPTPTPRPGTNPTPTPDPGTGQFQVNTLYQISIPWADSTAATATTTPARAFTVPPFAANGQQNYRLTRFNPRTQTYEVLNNSSVLRRGEGYFLRPLLTAVDFKTPTTDPSRRPTGVTEFAITLRRNPSLNPADPNNGFNLIGFPFDPARFSASDWLTARVVLPDGRRYNTVQEAVAAGVISPTLFTLANDGSTNYVNTSTLVPFKGYFARTFVDGLQVFLRAR